ncbi:MAG: pseudouridine synthase [Candidatus Omnitrophica bacterium]|nr:pseudouridine synthase [Candidatus Omnitrophota bacterium]
MNSKDDIKKKLQLFQNQNYHAYPLGEVRINKYLSLCGIGSRREVEEYILQGKVLINGVPIKDLSYKVKKTDLVILDGKRIRPIANHIYIAVNKPKEYLVSKKRFNSKEKLVYDLIPENIKKQYHLGYAGRLDKNSRGLVILSSDGIFLYHLTQPKYKVLKKYYVQLDDSLTLYDFNLLTGKGVIENGERLRAISIQTKDAKNNIYEVVLMEGKKRHIRRMFNALLYEVIDLYRYAIGNFSLEEFIIPEGEYKEFDPSLVWKDS